MPSSYIDSVPPIVHLLQQVSPRRVVDVGCGWGKYGLLCREYLPNLDAIIGIDAHFPSDERLRRVQAAVYDDVWRQDVRTISRDLWERLAPDLTLMIDVIEHMSKDDGHAAIWEALQHGPLLVSTPKLFFHQHDDENPYEDHVSHWDWSDFIRHGIAKDLSTIDSLIFLVGAEL